MNDDFPSSLSYEIVTNILRRPVSSGVIYPVLVNDVIKDRKNRPKSLYKQSSLEKTLQKVCRNLTTRVDPYQTETDCSYGTFIEFYAPGSSTYDSAPLRYRVNNPEDESFTTVCWESFQFFARKYDEIARIWDGSHEKIPIIKIGKAVQRIVYTVTPQHINFVADYFGLLDDRSTTLSWGDFLQFVHQIVKTMPPPNIVLPASLDSTAPKSQGNLMLTTRDVSDKMYESVGSEEDGVAPDFICAKGTIFLSSLSNQPGLSASQNFAKEEILGIYRREEQFRREIKAKIRVGPRKNFEEEKPLIRLGRPLMKQQAHELIHVADSYPLKWEAMKMKRDRRYEQEERRALAKQVSNTISKFAISTEKSQLRALLSSETSNMGTVLRTEKQKYLREQNMITRKNIISAKEHFLQTKAESSSTLKSSLLLSTLRSNKILADEVHMRNLLKESTRNKGRAQDESSTLYETPADILEKIRSATSAADFEKAQSEAAQAFNFAASAKIRAYTQSRKEALLRASMKGAMITIVSSPGADLFKDPGIGQEMCGKAMFKPALPPPISIRAITPHQSVTNLDAGFHSLGIKKYGHTSSGDFLDSSVLMTEANRRQNDYMASSVPPSHSTELIIDASAVSSKSFLAEGMRNLDNNIAYQQQGEGKVNHVRVPDHYLENHSIMDDEVDDMSSAGSNFS